MLLFFPGLRSHHNWGALWGSQHFIEKVAPQKHINLHMSIIQIDQYSFHISVTYILDLVIVWTGQCIHKAKAFLVQVLNYKNRIFDTLFNPSKPIPFINQSCIVWFRVLKQFSSSHPLKKYMQTLNTDVLWIYTKVGLNTLKWTKDFNILFRNKALTFTPTPILVITFKLIFIGLNNRKQPKPVFYLFHL